jgi:hypothetical protein
VRAGDSTSVQAAPVAPVAGASTKIDNTLYGANHVQGTGSVALAPDELSQSIHVDIDVTPSGVAHSATTSVAPVAVDAAAGPADPAVDEPAPRRRSIPPRRIAAAAVAVALAAAVGFAATAKPGASAAAGAPEAQPVTTASEVAIGETRADQGILVVTQAAGAPMRVDGVVRGDGQAVRLPLVAGKHTVSREGGHSVVAVDITAGKVTRVDLKAD